MRNLDNTIKYYELLMYYDDTSNYIDYALPKGYHFEFYKSGDENNWVDIVLSCGLITSKRKAHIFFHQFFDSFIDELDKRCIFIVDDESNEKIATVTISKVEEYGFNAAVDWFAIKKEYQGKRLSRPLITRFIKLTNNLGHKTLILHTQTTTPLAASLYLDAGFKPFNIEDKIGWKILKRLTNHKKLNGFISASDEEMYDYRNILIEKKLNEIYGIDNFYYSVWYTNGLHNVDVYSNDKSDEYEYYLAGENITLVKMPISNIKNVITTNRLLIRPIQMDDLNDIYEYASDSSINMMMFLPKETKEETKEFVLFAINEWEKENPKDREYVILLNGKIIGGINLEALNEKNKYEIGWIIHKNYRRNGYATEAAKAIIEYAFKSLNANYIQAHCDINNIASKKVMNNTGMTLEDSNGTRIYPKTGMISKECLYTIKNK